ncbi:hypothetical protein C8E00_103334 [Chromohalobacter marismortui]|uniref:Uncharacterized protein n=1 Tax=Chromohalobacter marismortui TaxID=42055 RepID=A0A4R7NQN8_9GAMM|nr:MULTISPECIES: hypothetical protein [Chromohalobacter]MCI0508482.1 hypothetical protein [Chromohalobacter sp.]MCI0592227.1 hypothetical protein [Chromohalobacter sp.]TDU22962.1 hypothetical protein C8E00_103334 [Chromohalobacter marismortui]
MRHRLFITLLLAFLLPGLGHLFLRQWSWAALWMIGFIALLALMMIPVRWLGFIWLLLLLALWTASMVHAATLARAQANASTGRRHGAS